MEGGSAVFGGLGRVAMQMLSAQNKYDSEASLFTASIITPYYPNLHSSYSNMQTVATVKHLYNDELVTSTIFIAYYQNNPHFLVVPPKEYAHIFNIKTLPEIYWDTENSSFIDRVKFFNSCVAAYLATFPKESETTPILQLHDWQASLVPKLLQEIHYRPDIKSVFTVHIDSGDRGTYPSSALNGIGLSFNKKLCILKAIGLVAADKIVAVSPKFLRECIETVTDNNELEFLRKIFALSSAQGKTVGIGNGINYDDYCPLGKHIPSLDKINESKSKLKKELVEMLCSKRLNWRFDPNLPLILYVGRYSPEKGSAALGQIIQDTLGRATFVAIGRGMTEDVLKVMLTHSRQTDNVFITCSEEEQAKWGALIRAAADIVIIPSHRDAFGLVGPESLANGCVVVTTGVGGLKDVITSIDVTNANNTSGNGIFYEDLPDGEYNPDLTKALNAALKIWQDLTPSQINNMQARIMQDAQRFDWVSPKGPLAQYLEIYKDLRQNSANASLINFRKQGIV